MASVCPVERCAKWTYHGESDKAVLHGVQRATAFVLPVKLSTLSDLLLHSLLFSFSRRTYSTFPGSHSIYLSRQLTNAVDSQYNKRLQIIVGANQRETNSSHVYWLVKKQIDQKCQQKSACQALIPPFPLGWVSR